LSRDNTIPELDKRDIDQYYRTSYVKMDKKSRRMKI